MSEFFNYIFFNKTDLPKMEMRYERSSVISKMEKELALKFQSIYNSIFAITTMKEKLDSVIILDGIINNLKRLSQNQGDTDNMIILTKLADRITQVKKQYMFERQHDEYLTASLKR